MNRSTSWRRRARSLRSGTALLGFAGALLAGGVVHARPQVAVMLGDSYAAGEGGRWEGNSEASVGSGDRSGTDIAAYPTGDSWGYDPGGLAYEEQSYNIGSNRSFSAPINQLLYQGVGAPALYQNVFNLAASGAKTVNVLPYEAGGKNYHGEAPQLERLKSVADANDIKLIVIGVGGNDAKFREALTSCLDAWAKENFTSLHRACSDDIREDTLAILGDVWYNVGRVIDETRELMSEKGQTGYKILLMGVPAVIPGPEAEWKYGASSRGETRGCPVTTDDARYVNYVLIPKLNATLRAVAQGKGVDFLSPEAAFLGHRLCEQGTVRASTPAGVGPAQAEWMRRLDRNLGSISDAGNVISLLLYDWLLAPPPSEPQPNVPGNQGSIQESFHPNAFGQEALGYCIRGYVQDAAPSPKALKCANGPSRLPTDMVVTPMAPQPVISYSTDSPTGDNGPWTVVNRFVQFTGTRKVMRVNLDFVHPRKGHLDIEIVDPSGHVYVFRRPNPNDTGAWPSAGKALMFYHEGPFTYLPYQDGDFQPGTYTLRYRDAITGYSGTFTDWQINFF